MKTIASILAIVTMCLAASKLIILRLENIVLTEAELLAAHPTEIIIIAFALIFSATTITLLN